MARDRKLTHEERVLWHKVSVSVRPLARRADAAFPEPGESPPEEPTVPDVVGMATSPGGKTRLVVPSSRERPQAGPSRPLDPIERPVKRKIARGRLALDARLDLHGMFQAEAHDLLHSFLLRAQERGLRHVLVITGKGSSVGSEGILKRAVPQWLAKAGFRGLVSGYETAARGHGGEGALYIRIKRRRGEET